MKQAQATLRWLSPDEGGRSEPPTGPSYSTVARFKEQRVDWTTEAWSLVVEFEVPPNDRQMVASVRFLVEDAPEELLHAGSEFELLEGTRLVAEGTVL